MVVTSGDVSGVNNLIKSGENVNAIDDHKNTPLHLLGGINDSDNQVVIAELLVNAGADVNAKNLYDWRRCVCERPDGQRRKTFAFIAYRCGLYVP